MHVRPHYAWGIRRRRFHSERPSENFSVHTTPEEFKNAKITGHFGFVFEQNSVRKFVVL